MHHLQTTQGNEVQVAPPLKGELMVGNLTGAWQPLPANLEDELKVLTQKLGALPTWEKPIQLPENVKQLRQAAIDDPHESDFGIAAIGELQLTVRRILAVLRTFDMIDR